MISTLVALKWPSNLGYAIAPLERMFFELGVELAAGDQGRVHFVYSSLDAGPPRALPADFANVHVHDLTDVSRPALQRLEEFTRRERIDLVIGFDLQPVHPAFRSMRRGGVKAIVSYWGAPISSIQPVWKRTLKRIALAMSNSRLDGLIFESRAMADLAVMGRGVPEDMIDIVHLGVDIDRFKPEPSAYVHDAFNIPPTCRVVVFSGHCTPRKGIKTLVEAAIELLAGRGRQDVHFLVCGNTGDESTPFEAMYKSMGCGDRITFAGYRNDLLQIFQSSFCGVIPSSGWDSFPRSAVEMAATGLPVVASRLQGLKEAVLDQRTGLLFETGNSKALADCLELLLEAPDRAKQLGSAGRLRCEQELNLETQRLGFRTAVRRRLPSR